MTPEMSLGMVMYVLDKHWDKLVIKSFLHITVPFQFQQSEPQTILQMWQELDFEISLPSDLALHSEFFSQFCWDVINIQHCISLNCIA